MSVIDENEPIRGDAWELAFAFAVLVGLFVLAVFWFVVLPITGLLYLVGLLP